MDIDGRKVVACGVREGLPPLDRVCHLQRQVKRRILGVCRKDVTHSRHLVAPPAAIRLTWMHRGAAARVGVAGAGVGGVEIVSARARVYIPQPGAVVELTLVIELIEYSHEPWPRAVIRRVVVVLGGAGEGGVALRTIAAAGGAARVLYGQHRHAGLDAIAEHATRAIQSVVVDQLIEAEAVAAQRRRNRLRGQWRG